LVNPTQSRRFRSLNRFFDDLAAGDLPQVSWLDPNFMDVGALGDSVFTPDDSVSFPGSPQNANDDHPPVDIAHGQAMITSLIFAMMDSPIWEKLLFVIVYDEHGGFYDHQSPPTVSDDTGYATLGVRVPALVVGPRVKRQVSHQVFQHTSLIKTILTRFADDPRHAIAQMPARVASLEHIGALLEDAPRTDIPEPDEAHAAIDAWRTKAREQRRAAAAGSPSPAPDGAGQDFVAHDFQDEFVRFALAMREAGLPPGQP
jgi:phospholipase C